MTSATTDDLARLFDISPQRIRELGRKGLLVKQGRGVWDRDGSTTAYLRHLRGVAAQHASDDGKVDATLEGALLKRSQRTLNELKQAELERRMVSIDTLTPAWSRAAAAIKGAVLAIPGKCRTRLPHLTAHDGETIDDLCRAALQDARATVMPSGTGEVAADDDSDDDGD